MSKCRIGLHDTKDEVIMKIGEDYFNINQVEELFKQHVDDEHAHKMYRKIKNQIIGFINPGIPTVIHYVNTVKTTKFFEYSNEFSLLSKKMVFPIPVR